jgi:hypothetical protein
MATWLITRLRKTTPEQQRSSIASGHAFLETCWVIESVYYFSFDWPGTYRYFAQLVSALLWLCLLLVNVFFTLCRTIRRPNLSVVEGPAFRHNSQFSEPTFSTLRTVKPLGCTLSIIPTSLIGQCLQPKAGTHLRHKSNFIGHRISWSRIVSTACLSVYGHWLTWDHVAMTALNGRHHKLILY